MGMATVKAELVILSSMTRPEIPAKTKNYTYPHLAPFF
jgi:hypothetical protein